MSDVLMRLAPPRGAVSLLVLAALAGCRDDDGDGDGRDASQPETALVFVDVNPTPDLRADQRRPPEVDAPAAADGPTADAPAERPDAAVEVPGASDGGLPNGQPCTSDAGCASRFCVDKVCCEARCDGACWSCANAHTGGPSGLCRPRNAGSLCGLPSCAGNMLTVAPRCNGLGSCIAQRPQPCPGGAACESGTSCKSCASGAECAATQFCDRIANACRPRGESGDACQVALDGGDCLSGHCSPDGVCCDRACNETCRSCVKAKNGQETGRCLPIPAGSDPDNECRRDDVSSCGLDGMCDGNGACRRYADGTVCGRDCCTRGGGGPRPCAYVCRGGACDREEPTVGDRCVGQSCCCPNGGPGGAPACTSAATCPAGPQMCM